MTSRFSRITYSGETGLATTVGDRPSCVLQRIWSKSRAELSRRVLVWCRCRGPWTACEEPG